MRFGPSLAVGALLLLPLAASAQSITALTSLGNLTGGPFTMSVSPQYPAPYSQVTVSVTSSSLNLENATLTATVGGKQIYTGAAHSFPVQLGAAGTVTSVHATVSSLGSIYSQTLSIRPQDVVLVVEPISSAPPLYPGKPSVPLQGNVRLVAMANLKDASGKASSPSTYSYIWTVDDVEQIYASGIGKSSIIVPSPLQYRESNVSVVVSSGSVSGGASLSYSALDPVMRVYESDPLLGIRYGHALANSYAISGAEATLYAAPFSLPITNGAPRIQWFLNGTSVQTGNSVTLRPAGSGQGSASLSVTASGDNSTSASVSLSLIFGNQAHNNLFGL